MPERRPAVFLDRDGVINEDHPDYVKSWEEFRFIRGARPALRRLAEAGIPVVIITNQSAVNRGIISRETLEGIHGRMVRAVSRAGGRISGIYYCPHRPEEGCECRKPAADLFFRAAREHHLNLKKSIFVGDTLKDLEAGSRAGCRTLLVKTGQGRETINRLFQGDEIRSQIWITGSLLESVDLILQMLNG